MEKSRDRTRARKRKKKEREKGEKNEKILSWLQFFSVKKHSTNIFKKKGKRLLLHKYKINSKISTKK